MDIMIYIYTYMDIVPKSRLVITLYLVTGSSSVRIGKCTPTSHEISQHIGYCAEILPSLLSCLSSLFYRVVFPVMQGRFEK